MARFGIESKTIVSLNAGMTLLLFLSLLYHPLNCVCSRIITNPSYLINNEVMASSCIRFWIYANQMWLQVPILNRENEERVQLQSLQEDIRIVCLWIVYCCVCCGLDFNYLFILELAPGSLLASFLSLVSWNQRTYLLSICGWMMQSLDRAPTMIHTITFCVWLLAASKVRSCLFSLFKVW